MKAIRITEPGKIEMTELPMPVPAEGEALLKIRCCGICGADVASFTGNQPFTKYPRIPGHEFSAEIAELPKDYKGELKVGDVVTANPYFNCGECYSCRRGHVNCCHDNQTMGVQRDGSFCEYFVMPVERIFAGKGLSAEQLALIEPFSIGWHALSRCEIKPGDKVLVMGAGPIGLFALISAKRKGAEVHLADLLDGRLEKAKGFVYCVSSMGVTGQQADFHRNVLNYLKEVKSHAKVPVMMGFGIRTAKDVEPMKDIIDGCIVGSHFINLMEESRYDVQVAKNYVTTFKKEMNV